MFMLELQSRVPIYEQLYKNIIKLTALGVLKPNEQLPSVRALAAQMGINPNTVSKAYNLLEHDGIIYSTVGKGSFISPDISGIIQKRVLAVDALRSSLKKAIGLGLTKEELNKIINAEFTEGGGFND